ncbi:MAG: hypothetical protein ACXU86_04640 [Archangium sp.]
MRYVLLALSVLVGLPGLAQAQQMGTYNPRLGGVTVSCTSYSGQPVLFVPNSSLADFGQAFPERPGVPPTIEFNPGLLSRVPSWLQLFWFGHECAHVELADYGEERADCRSLQLLKQQGLVSRTDVLEMQSAFASGLNMPWSHRPGPTRAQRLLECYDRTAMAVGEDGQVVSGSSVREEYLGVKRWRFCSHIPGVSVPTSSGHVTQGSCEKERARLQREDASYVVTECVLTSSERCSAEQE